MVLKRDWVRLAARLNRLRVERDRIHLEPLKHPDAITEVLSQVTIAASGLWYLDCARSPLLRPGVEGELITHSGGPTSGVTSKPRCVLPLSNFSDDCRY